MLVTKDFWRATNTVIYGAMTPHYHLIPLLLLLAGITILRRKTQDSALRRMLLIQLLWLYAVLTLSHIFIQPYPYLIIMLYSSYIIPAVFLWLGGMVAPHI
ncbi:MAG TPA: hypothetical protein PLZ51_22555, partial [Aggregatilineales bacterium]|nr:hypothetical protein [Aggregatilineales bacterium]